VAGNELKTKINDWVNKQTNGLIKNIVNDTIADANTVLANALYLKSSWAIPFNENLTHEDDFKTANGELVKKEYMQVYDTFNYYKDDNSELVVIPLQNDISMVCVKGDTNNLFEKIYNCDGKYLNLNIPKIDMEKEYCKKEFVNFLQQNGVTFATDMEKADFSNMIDAQIYIDDIIQKTKIKTDENGLEAAAVTAVIMKDNAIPGIQQEPILVEFNESFKFYIYNFNADGTTPELLFYGKYAQ
jgi:serpin B